MRSLGVFEGFEWEKRITYSALGFGVKKIHEKKERVKSAFYIEMSAKTPWLSD